MNARQPTDAKRLKSAWRTHRKNGGDLSLRAFARREARYGADEARRWCAAKGVRVRS